MPATFGVVILSKTVKRGSSEKDAIEFTGESLTTLYKAAKDVYYLLNQGYRIKGASVFVGNHYLLSERQRLALVRGVTSKEHLEDREKKELLHISEGSTVHIDAFNTIITLEVALSGSLLIKSMDGTIRDLAGLRGTYRLIDKTAAAILLIGERLEKCKVGKAIFYIDTPVSNSGRLKEAIYTLLGGHNFALQVETTYHVDSILGKLDQVVTSDAIILDTCKSWINLNRTIIEDKINSGFFVDFSKVE